MRRQRHHTWQAGRIKALSQIAPLLSWRQLSMLPWVFRFCYLLIGLAVLLLTVVLLFMLLTTLAALV